MLKESLYSKYFEKAELDPWNEDDGRYGENVL
jgi:hypothetical protein